MSNRITFPDITDLTVRNYKSEDDLDKIVKVWNESRHADGVDHPLTREELKNEFDHLENFDPTEDVFFVDIEDETVGSSMIWWDDETRGTRLYRFYVKVIPEFRGSGITRAMVKQIEDRGKEIADSHPDKREKKFYVFTNEEEENFRSVLESEGYEVYRYGIKMKRSDLENIADYELPNDVEMRPVKPEHFEKIRSAWNRACEDLRSQVPLSKSSWKEWEKDESFDPSLWSIAWHKDEVVGTCFGFINKKENEVNDINRGHTEFISTKKEWRGKGIAKALIASTLKKLKEAGMEEAFLGVDSENPSGAVHLYKKLGFKKVGNVIFYEKVIA